ncbi:hypothetical protein D3C83_244330 [compost metagenome]
MIDVHRGKLPACAFARARKHIEQHHGIDAAAQSHEQLIATLDQAPECLRNA